MYDTGEQINSLAVNTIARQEKEAENAESYLRLIEKWHPRVPKMTARGALVLTHAANFGKKYPRVKAISPDRIPVVVRKAFATNRHPVPDPAGFLKSISAQCPDVKSNVF